MVVEGKEVSTSPLQNFTRYSARGRSAKERDHCHSRGENFVLTPPIGSPSKRMEVHRSRCCTPITCEFSKCLPMLTEKCYPNRLNKSLIIGQPKNLYNCARDTVYQRFSPNDWMSSNKSNFDLSDRERGQAYRVVSDAWRAVKETDARTRNRQSENQKRLSDRVNDIAFWKNELNDEIKNMEQEMEAVDEHRRLLERALQDTFNPLKIAEDNLGLREHRMEIDKVHDEVERSLSKEICLIKCVQDKLRKYIQKVDAQQRLNRAALCDLEKDATDKHHAQHLDERMHGLRNTSTGIAYHPGIECYDNTITNPDAWINFTRNNIMRSQKEREMSEKLRGEVDSLLRHCSNQMWHSFNNVNNAFNSRQKEMTDARNKLQAHLNKTNQAIMDMEKNIDFLRQAIALKDAPLKVAQTRLEERTRRINVENCRDDSMNNLIREVNEIKDSIRYLNDKLAQSNAAMSRLHRTKATLEHDISLKENSLHIDNSCLGQRRSFPMEGKAGPIMNMTAAY